MGVKKVTDFISNHLILVGGISLLFILRKYFPSVFVYIVSSSPVIICSLLLLGVLLSFSEPQTPQTKEANRSHDKTCFVGNGKYKCSSGKVHTSGKKKKIELYQGRENSVSTSKVVTFLNNRYRGIKRDVVVLGASTSGQSGRRDRSSQIEYSRGGKIIHGHKQERSKSQGGTDYPASLKDGNTQSRRRDCEELSLRNNNDNDEALSSNSGGGECSSPDASVEDITPALDELHPLLDVETDTGVRVSDLDDASTGSSLDGSEDEEIENIENEEGEETQEGKDDGIKAVVKWTADDEKNLRDVGKSELERNQRLEHLIAKRRARSFHRIEVEKNLIDFDSNDPPSVGEELSHLLVTIPPRRNPFDLPFSSEGTTGLPPIPGSAPSVLLPSRNPFDLPYDHDTETTGHTAFTFTNQEFKPVPQGDLPFTRPERISFRPNFATGAAEERKDNTFHPYAASGGTNNSASIFGQFQSQSSGIGGPGISSIQKSNSSHDISNSMNKDAKQNLSTHYGPTSLMNHSAQQDHPSTHDNCSNEEDERCEGIIAHVGHDADSIVSSEDTDVDDQALALSPVTTREQNGKQSGELTPISHDTSVVIVEKRNSNTSSTSCSNIYDESANKKFTQKQGGSPSGSQDSVQSILAESEVMSRNDEALDEKQTADPVYDSSPSDIEHTISNVTSLQEALINFGKKDLHSCPSLASDLLVELSESGSPRNDQFLEEEPTTSSVGHWVASADLASVEQMELGTREVQEINEHDVIHASRNRWEQNVGVRGGVSPAIVDHLSNPLSNATVQNDKIALGNIQTTTETNNIVATKFNPGRLVVEDLATRAAILLQSSSDDSLPPPSPPTTFGIVETKIDILPSIPEEIIEDLKHEDENDAAPTRDEKILPTN